MRLARNLRDELQLRDKLHPGPTFVQLNQLPHLYVLDAVNLFHGIIQQEPFSLWRRRGDEFWHNSPLDIQGPFHLVTSVSSGKEKSHNNSTVT